MNTHNKPVPGRTAGKIGDDRAMYGARLRAAMEAALTTQQMSVSGLAREAHVQRGDIYRWWRGESRPSRNSLGRIAEALDVDVAVLRQALGEPTIGSTASDDDLVAALRDHTIAISALVDLLRPLVEQADEGTAARLRAVEAELRSLRAEPTSEGSPRRSAPLGSAG